MSRTVMLGLVAALVVVSCGEVDTMITTAGSVPAASAAVSPSTTAPFTTAAPTTTLAVTTSSGGGQTVVVFEGSDECTEDMAVTPVEHTIPDSADPIPAAFERLLASLMDEERAAGMLRSAGVTDGLITVDFEDLTLVMNNASTTCGSFSLLAVLNATAFQFPEAERVTYQIEGSCDAFFGWLQRECQQYTRP